MKKVLFVIAFCAVVIAANAQDNKATTAPTNPAQIQQVAPKGRPAPIKEADLMKPIKDDYTKQYPGSTFQRCMKMDNPKTGVFYDVLIRTKDKEMIRLHYDKDGKFLKKIDMPKPVVKPAEAPAQPQK
jgi:hypothetical protein